MMSDFFDSAVRYGVMCCTLSCGTNCTKVVFVVVVIVVVVIVVVVKHCKFAFFIQ